MKNRKNRLNLLAISAFTLLSLASWSAPRTALASEPPLENEEAEKEEFGITQRENDLDDYEDLRPDREGFVDNTEPDTGELVDHIFEFEEMAANGSSRAKDHMCSGISYVTSAEFSGNLAVECVDINNSFTLLIESDKEVKIPMIIGLNNNETPGGQLGGVLNVTNNGKPVFDKTAIISPEGDPAEGAPAGYFDMVDVESTLSLVKGTNRINFRLTKNQINLDYVNLRTSANIVNKTTSAWDTPIFEVAVAPTETQPGTLSIKCGNCGEVNNNRYLPKLSEPCYKVTEEGYIKTYSLPLAGQDFVVAEIDNNPENVYPSDDGVLKDNYFEFEKAEIKGNSQGEDHFCAGKSLVYGLGFSGDYCLEAVDANTSLGFTINSDKRVEVPFKLKINNYHHDNQLAAKLIAKNNGNTNKVDLSAIIPSGGEYVDVGGLTSYFQMVEVSGKVKLDVGENKIEFIPKETGFNFDSINLQTSATLINNTTSYWNDEFTPKFEVVKSPTLTDRGTVKMTCPTGTGEKCVRSYDYIYPLTNQGYIKEENGDKTNVYMNTLNGKLLVGVIDKGATGDFEFDFENTKDNYFEFEESSIVGGSGNVNGIGDHFCAAEALIYSAGFSGGFCLENTGNGTKFSFNINSNKKALVKFEVGTATSIGGKPLGSSLDITNNGKKEAFDTSGIVPTEGQAPDVGGLEYYFRMVRATGTLMLEKGENKIEFTLKEYGINLDFFNIKTTATLTNNTKGIYEGSNTPTFEVIKAPTANEKGSFKVTCAKNGCSKGSREYNYLPVLSNPYYTVKADGYYMTLLGKEIKVASK